MGQEAGATQRGGEGALAERGVACPSALSALAFTVVSLCG